MMDLTTPMRTGNDSFRRDLPSHNRPHDMVILLSLLAGIQEDDENVS